MSAPTAATSRHAWMEADLDGIQLRRWGVVAVAFGLAGCSPVVPKWREVDRVEQVLATNACIGAVNRWDRRYFYMKTKGREVLPIEPARDVNIVGFLFNEAGVGEYRPGRRLGDVERFIGYDHQQRRAAMGEVDLRTGEANIWFCGLVCGPSVPAGGFCG